MKFKIKKGDLVRVISGDDKGKEGKVLSVLADEGRAFVEGINIVSKHTKPNPKNQKGGIIKKEAPIQISKLMLVDPSTGEPSRAGRKVVDGKLKRYFKKSGQIIQ